MLILASSSPRRKELLLRRGFDFTVIAPAGVGELSSGDPEAVVCANAAAKAAAVSAAHPHDIVLGADTVVALDGEILGKPRAAAEARAMLRKLSGRTHSVYTGVAVARGAELTVECTVSEVSFRVLSEEDVSRYLSLVDVLDKAGAYAIQEHPELILESLSGDRDNVIGLPMRLPPLG